MGDRWAKKPPVPPGTAFGNPGPRAHSKTHPPRSAQQPTSGVPSAASLSPGNKRGMGAWQGLISEMGLLSNAIHQREHF